MQNKDEKIGVAIISPSSYAVDEAAYYRGLALLETQGCQVHSYYDAQKIHHRFAASDEERIAQFHAAAQNPDVHIVMALRGGYGLSRILPQLDFAMLAASAKKFVGHSDFTAFHLALLAQTGATSYAGPMLCDDFSSPSPSEYTHQHFWQVMKNGAQPVQWTSSNKEDLNISGCVWGGNLSMLVHLIGTPWMPNIQDGILFIEDIHEQPYRVERMLLQLLAAGILQKQKALLIGDFAETRVTNYDNGYTLESVLLYIQNKLSIPIVTGLPFGHIKNKVTITIGRTASLTCDKQEITLN